jgi:hypothetical protein
MTFGSGKFCDKFGRTVNWVPRYVLILDTVSWVKLLRESKVIHMTLA